MRSVEIAAKLVVGDRKGQGACSAKLSGDRRLEGLFLSSSNPVVGHVRWSDVSCSDPRRSRRSKVLPDYWFGESREECAWNCRYSSALKPSSAVMDVHTRLHCGSLCASAVAHLGLRRFWTDE